MQTDSHLKACTYRHRKGPPKVVLVMRIQHAGSQHNGSLCMKAFSVSFKCASQAFFHLFASAGFTGDGTSCVDFDECTVGLHNCDVNAECNNIEAGYRCTCQAGFTGTGKISAWKTRLPEIKNVTSSSFVGSMFSLLFFFWIKPNASFSLHQWKQFLTLRFILSFSLQKKKKRLNCIVLYFHARILLIVNNFPRTLFEVLYIFVNFCFSLFALGQTCADINECLLATHSCHDNALCSNTVGSFDCACQSGFSGNGSSCIDQNECLIHQHNCSEVAECQNTNGAYSCACTAGFQGDGLRCDDVDECSTGQHNCSNVALCGNVFGSFNCTCMAGYSGDGVSCDDIDECSASVPPCHGNATCYNSDGSFSCSCDGGFSGSGFSCFDINECLGGNHDCHAEAVCNNLDGSYECMCLVGYRGNGTACNDVNECIESNHACHRSASCSNIAGKCAKRMRRSEVFSLN